MSPRYEKSSRLQELSPKSTYDAGGSTNRYYEGGRTAAGSSSSSYLDSSRIHLNGSGLNRSASNFMSSYHSGSATYHRSQPSSYTRSHHDEYPSSLSPSLKSPSAAKPYEKYGSYSETNSPRDYTGHHHAPSVSQRKYSFEGLESGTGGQQSSSSSRPEYSSYTPKGTRRYEALSSPEQQSPRRPATADTGKRGEEQQQQPWLDSSSYRPYLDRDNSALLAGYRSGREAVAGGSVSRKYPAEMSRGRDPVRETAAGSVSSSGRSNFLSSLKFPSWTLSSPLSIRKFRTSSSTDRATGFERSVRHQPTYRSLNEKDKQLYSSSGKSDKL
jgi:hypothetical protein